MAKPFLTVASTFVSFELFAAYLLYCDVDRGGYVITPGVFRGYTQFKNAVEPLCGETVTASALRTVEFFGVWAANSKFIFSLLLMCCATSSCQRTRVIASASMVIGCAVYFLRMHPMMMKMEAEGDVRERKTWELRVAIGNIFIPIWFLVFRDEWKSYRATCTNKNCFF